MRLLDNWKAVLAGAWSVRFTVATIVFAVLEVLLPYLEYRVDQGVFIILAVVTAVGSVVSRIIDQDNI